MSWFSPIDILLIGEPIMPIIGEPNLLAYQEESAVVIQRAWRNYMLRKIKM
jgi:hypothetical protein